MEDIPPSISAESLPLTGKNYKNGFHELVQSAIHAYIAHQRMAKTAQRLLDSKDSIKAIFLDSGYKKQRNFNNTFKTYNMTPAAYRRLQRDRIESR
ncbi:MAG TPA: helix-turn-helix domain-containing protein [Puia sp.]